MRNQFSLGKKPDLFFLEGPDPVSKHHFAKNKIFLLLVFRLSPKLLEDNKP